jgi:alpha-1,3-rhamnosyl/mannosyltransferase
VEILGLHPDRIQVIYHGVAESFFRVTPGDAAWAIARFGLRRPYILFVGTIEPRKNLGRLLDAYAEMRSSLREEIDLVIAGVRGWAPPELLARLRMPLPGVRYLGYVTEDLLPGLTAGATLSIYPSLYEGFGFPVVQAMAAGVPVIASSAGSLPEIAGDAALFVDPRSVSSLRDAMEKVLLSATMRFDLAQKGRIRAQRYRWRDCATTTWAFFEQVVGRER